MSACPSLEARASDCARAELLIAAGAASPLSADDAEFLPAHLSRCLDCRQIALDPPAGESIGLPQVARDTYVLGAEIGRGGMGRILSAHDRRIGRAVALKEMLSNDPSALARFEREARITARLQHPGIVSIYEVGRWPDDRPFYAMPILPGRTLREAIEAAGGLTERLALIPAVLAAAEAVAYAHSRRVIHRDLTPSNVLLGSFGETIVIDWGVAKELDAEEGGPPEASSTDLTRLSASPLTVAGTVMGTAAYIPPEQADGATVDERADVYALGAILHHVLTGRHPYFGLEVSGVVARLRARQPAPLPVEGPVPRQLVAIVRKAMALEPTDRYPTAQELVDRLRRYLGGGSSVLDYLAFGLRALVRRRRWAAGVFALVMATSGLALWMMPRTYHVETTLVGQKNPALPDRRLPGAPPAGRARSPFVSPSDLALRTVLNRDNLLALVPRAELLASWQASRRPAQRLWDWVGARLGRAGDQPDQAVARALESRLRGRIEARGGDESIVLTADWPEGPMGRRLVTAARESFLKVRQLQELAVVAEPLAILSGRATSMRAEIEGTARSLRRRVGGKPEPAGRKRATPRGGAEASEALQVLWHSRRDAIEDLEKARWRRLAELQQKLAEPIPPTIGSIEALSESPQAARLRSDLADLGRQRDERPGRAQPEHGSLLSSAADGYDPARMRALGKPAPHDDGDTAFAKEQLRYQTEAFERVLQRIEQARLELETVRAAFPYRYVVTAAAQAPDQPARPRTSLVLGLGLVVAFLGALLAAVTADLRSARRPGRV